MAVSTKKIYTSLICLALLLAWVHPDMLAQSAFTSRSSSDSVAGIMFYNVENLFDVRNDSLKNDDEFLPQGARRWTYSRMKQKMTRISKVILNAGGWNPPVLVGLCEVENKWVLTTMIRETGLNNLGYRVVHFESPDERGIDVALLYRASRFEIASAQPIPVNFGETERPTRDILYAKGILDRSDTLHVLVNHWPSKLGGAMASHWKREAAALVVKNITDSIYSTNPKALMIIMGDFNEEPDSDIFLNTLKAGKTSDGGILVNPALYLKKGVGTLKHQHEWVVFDQIIVSRSLLEGNSAVKMASPSLRIIDFPFLLERHPTFGGMRPFRTYIGFKYADGYSDHLPVWIDLMVEQIKD